MSGSLGEQGKINTGLLPAPALTEADNSFSTWVDTDFTTGAYVTATDWTGNTTSTWKGVTPEPRPIHEFNYDANGYTTRVITTSADGLTTSQVTYEWDALDQLVGVVKGSHRSEFTYDGQGRRVKIVEKDGGQVTEEKQFVWEGLAIAEQRRPIDGASDRAFYPQGVVWEGNNVYYKKDHLGSIRSASMPSYKPEPLGNYSYDAYGNVSESGDYSPISDMLYTGHYYHRHSGLYLAPYRAYDPKIGEWLSRDPIGHAGGMNLYAYVSGNPLNATDPSGSGRGCSIHVFNTDACTDCGAAFNVLRNSL